MRVYDILEKKKNNKKLSKEEIEFIINNYDNIPDYQISALLMAICINGMDEKETLNLTLAMANSGQKLDLEKISGTVVDKHSTGGVGDKTTLIVCPIVACLGLKVAKMSGRGLGFSGGTADKLESIPGFNINLSLDEFINLVNKNNISLITNTGNFAPVDKKIYALRDVTATIDSIPLIASSIMSKKLAIGADVLVLDVKAGNGAFMKDEYSALELSKQMVKIGNNANKKTVALISDMNQPLGKNIGNALEVIEVIEVLKNKGPDDLREVSIELATWMVSLGKNISYDEARGEVVEVIRTGEALYKFEQLVASQGGDLKSFCDIEAIYEEKVKSKESGYIEEINTEIIGQISVELGAGRIQKEDQVDYTAGIVLNKKIGDYVEEGEVLAYLYSSKVDPETYVNEYLEAITYSNNKVNPPKLIIDIIKE